MTLKEKINEDLKTAMKSGDKLRLATIRSLRALILEHEKSGKDKVLTPQDEINLLTTASKKRKESIEQFRKGGREDLAVKEEKELAVIEEYLPKQLSEEEVCKEVKRIASEIGAASKADFPKLMPAAIKELKGKTDGKIVKECVEKVLDGN